MERSNALRRALVAAWTAAACALMVGLAATTSPLSAAEASASTDPAVRWPADGAAMRSALAIAAAHWSQTPCAGTVDLRWSPMDSDLRAVSDWTAWDAAKPSTYSNCSITFNSAVAFDGPMLCTVMAHEVGHLLGHAHTDAAGDLMNPVYAGPIPECAAFEVDPAAAAPVAAPATVPSLRARAALSTGPIPAGDVASARAALAVAKDYWKRTPCHGAVQFRWAPLQREMEAKSAWSAFPGRPASTYTDCVVTLNASKQWTWPRFCSVIVHEVGHLTGHRHTRRGVMSERYRGVVPACRAAGS